MPSGAQSAYNFRFHGGPIMPANTALSDLASKQCKACDDKTGKLERSRSEALLKSLPGWSLDGEELVKTYNFKNYYETMAFVNAMAWISHREDHHPDLTVSYNRCVVRYSTHSVGGLSENDFICAAKVEMLSQ
jgi:4a-hydroxytetrahydrobiopterin dehydratase